MQRSGMIKNVIKVGSSTLLSRLFGVVREVAMVRFLGASVMADAFITAFKIPNSMRKIFAEGALTVSFVPTFVQLVKAGKKDEAQQLLTLTFIVVQTILITVCALIFFNADTVIRVIAPGWFVHDTFEGGGVGSTLYSWIQWFAPAWYASNVVEQAQYAATYLRIVISYIIFLSASSLLAGALQSVHHFLIPALSPVVQNIIFIASIAVCMHYQLPVEYLCYGIVGGGLCVLVLHIFAFLRLNLGFSKITSAVYDPFVKVVTRFIPSMLAMSVMEIKLFIGTSIASYLPKGAISLTYYANRFMGIPLGVFAVALSTVLLPYFSRLSMYAPRRLSFYLYETAKLIFWVTVPMALWMGFFSREIFATIFLSKKFSMDQVIQAGHILCAFLSGLFFFSFNKIILNVYYSFKETTIPAIIAVISALLYYMVSKVTLPFFGTVGLAINTVVTEVFSTIVLLYFLRRTFHVVLFSKQFVMRFLLRSCAQIIFVGLLFLTSYYILENLLFKYVPSAYHGVLFEGLGFWFWVVPLSFGAVLLYMITRSWFSIRLYLLD